MYPRLSKFIGIGSYLLSIFGITICFFLFPEAINSSHFALSDFGVEVKTAIIFNLTLIISSLLLALFITRLFTEMKISLRSLPGVFFILSTVALCGIGFFPYSISERIHFTFSFLYFLFSSLGIMFFGLGLMKKGRSSGKYHLGLGIFTIIIFFILYYSSDAAAVSEVFHTIIIGIWVTAVSFINPKKKLTFWKS